LNKHNFHGIFSLSTNISYFEGLLHSFRGSEDAKIRLRFLLDPKLRISTEGKPKVNLMLYHNAQDNSIELSYPWLGAVEAKLVFDDDYLSYTFSFNKNYLRFSKFVAEGWELIDVFRSLLQISLIKQGMYMVHAAALSLGKDGVLIPSFGNTGKTTTAWMLAMRGAGFVTDEFAILDSEGRCFGFPCSSLVSAGLVKSADLRLTKKQRLALRIRDAKSKFLSTRFAPGGVKLYPDDNFKTYDRVPITRLVFIQNGLDNQRQIDAKEAYIMLRAIQDYELNWRSNPYIIARSFFPPTFNATELSAREEMIMKNLISRVSSYLVSSSKGLHYQRIKNITKSYQIEEPHVSDPISQTQPAI